MKIVNDDSRVVNKLEVSLTDDARVVIYDRHMFIVQATANIRLSWKGLAGTNAQAYYEKLYFTAVKSLITSATGQRNNCHQIKSRTASRLCGVAR
jgi:hypothetical protein